MVLLLENRSGWGGTEATVSWSNRWWTEAGCVSDAAHYWGMVQQQWQVYKIFFSNPYWYRHKSICRVLNQWIPDYMNTRLYNLLMLSVHAAFKRMIPVVFEKDDDDNGHIDFVTAASVCGCFQFLYYFYFTEIFWFRLNQLVHIIPCYKVYFSIASWLVVSCL